jgi:hypothetical protein
VLVGNAQMSTMGQLLDRQLRALDEGGCAKVLSDQRSGRRPELRTLPAAAATVDVLPSLLVKS